MNPRKLKKAGKRLKERRSSFQATAVEKKSLSSILAIRKYSKLWRAFSSMLASLKSKVSSHNNKEHAP
jgi:hypothetical protein